ncbi:DUF2510 domain-containing protein [Actinoplanes sp. NBRC 101535]|uniref:DUF2510 domain-containing protein n=1 Tax=Actinoplanes sp. NBRC 101535 TaxID=3032196 RepID=UPI0024A075FE|nr:DUF2510 domain-containing protein [Actinoplanes sp. NBRC 101535]GLY08140.1 hypothetical protein Acsp01_85190 [Actinoplanes sp. NBRC 101535]
MTQDPATQHAPAPSTTVPAGWYADPHGLPAQRWWDGQAWTDHLHPDEPQPPVAQPPYLAVPSSGPSAMMSPDQDGAGGHPASYGNAEAYHQAGSYTPVASHGQAGSSTVFHGQPGAETTVMPSVESAPHSRPQSGLPQPGLPGSGLSAAGQASYAQPGAGAPASAAPAAGAPAYGAPGNVPGHPAFGTAQAQQPATFAGPIENKEAGKARFYGILSLFINIAFLPGIAALWFGFQGLSQAAKLEAAGHGPVGKGKAIAGLVCGGLGTLFAAVILLIRLLLLR